MKPQLAELLAVLTGDELYHLSVRLSGAVTTAAVTAVLETAKGSDHQRYDGLADELTELRNDVLMQACRIPVPIGRAQKIVENSMFGRGHIVRVPGTLD